MYKKASKLKLRFKTEKGLLSVEQLWELSIYDLVNAIKIAKKSINSEDTDLSFLEEIRKTDEKSELIFNILKDVYLTKKEELKSKQTERENKEFNEKILAIINEKQEGSLKEKSIAELETLLRK